MRTPAPLTGPERRPKSGDPARQLVILLHGLGADGNDLIGLADSLSDGLPDAAFIAPDAPFPCDMAPVGRQWFSLRDMSPSAVLEGVRAVAPAVDALIDTRLASLGLGADLCALVGFSQGAMLALHVGLRRAETLAGVLGYSGALIAPQLLPAEARSRPPVFLVHGSDDPVIPAMAMQTAVEGLGKIAVPTRSLARPGLGHGIDAEGLMAGSGFLVARLLRPAG